MNKTDNKEDEFTIDDAKDVLAIYDQRLQRLEAIMLNHEHVNGSVYTKL